MTATTTGPVSPGRAAERPEPDQDATASVGLRGVVVVGCDGSVAGQAAVDFAVREAVLRNAQLVAVSTFLLPDHAYRATAGISKAALTESLSADARAAARGALDLAMSRAGGPELDVDLQVANGRPSTLLLAAAEHADLLVVGARGSGGWRRLILGSVSTEVVHHASGPVVVVPVAGADRAEHGDPGASASSPVLTGGHESGVRGAPQQPGQASEELRRDHE